MRVTARFINMERKSLVIQSAVMVGVKALSNFSIKCQLRLGFYGVPTMLTAFHIKNFLSYLMIIALVYL